MGWQSVRHNCETEHWQCVKSEDITLPTEVHMVKAMVLPVVIYGCESWTVKKAEHQRIDAFQLWCCRRPLRVLSTARRSNQSILKGNQPWILIGRTDAEALILWSSDTNSWLVGKDPDTGKDWGKEEKGMTEDEMAGWHHRCNGHKLKQTSADGEGQGGLACCSPWDCEESDTTGQLNNKFLIYSECKAFLWQWTFNHNKGIQKRLENIFYVLKRRQLWIQNYMHIQNTF